MRRSRACDCATRSSVLTHLFERAYTFCRLTLSWARTTAPVHGSRLRVRGGGNLPPSVDHIRVWRIFLCLSSNNVLASFWTPISPHLPPLVFSCLLFSFFPSLEASQKFTSHVASFLCVSPSLFSFAATLDDFWQQLTAGRLMCRSKDFWSPKKKKKKQAPDRLA